MKVHIGHGLRERGSGAAGAGLWQVGSGRTPVPARGTLLLLGAVCMGLGARALRGSVPGTEEISRPIPQRPLEAVAPGKKVGPGLGFLAMALSF